MRRRSSCSTPEGSRLRSPGIMGFAKTMRVRPFSTPEGSVCVAREFIPGRFGPVSASNRQSSSFPGGRRRCPVRPHDRQDRARPSPDTHINWANPINLGRSSPMHRIPGKPCHSRSAWPISESRHLPAVRSAPPGSAATSPRARSPASLRPPAPPAAPPMGRAVPRP